MAGGVNLSRSRLVRWSAFAAFALLLSTIVSIQIAGGVTVGPGVTFQPSQSWANLSFVSSQTFTKIDVDPTGVTFDSVRFGMLKFPQALPRLDLTISTWNPFQTTVNGTVFDYLGNAPTGSSAYFLFSNVAPARQYLIQVDGTLALQRYSDATGNLSFSWTNWTSHRFTILFGWSTGTPPGPTVDFTFSPSNPGIGEVVNFSATSAGGSPPYVYSWNFGDGASAFGQSTSHAYASNGTYGVGLTVFDAAGATASIGKSVSVSSAPPTPKFSASFTYAPPNPLVNETISFGAVASDGTPPYAFAWDFGDGGMSSGPSVTHAYPRAGFFDVTLRATDGANRQANVTAVVTVRTSFPPSGNVSADFDYTVNGNTVTFVDRSTSSANLSIVSRFWAFGDQTSSRDARPVHTYNVTGLWFSSRYTVVLVACDSGGHCGSASKGITIMNWNFLYIVIGVTLALLLLLLFLVRRRRKKKEPAMRKVKGVPKKVVEVPVAGPGSEDDEIESTPGTPVQLGGG